MKFRTPGLRGKFVIALLVAAVLPSALALLEASFTDQDPQKTQYMRLAGVFFSTDTEKAKVTTAFVKTPVTPDPGGNHDGDIFDKLYIITSSDYDSSIADWSAYGSGYVRVVATGNSAGQVAKVVGFARAEAADAPGQPGVEGRLKVLVSGVCIAPVRDFNVPGSGEFYSTWPSSPPQKDDSLVFVKDTLFFRNLNKTGIPFSPGKPAFITVKEILENDPFKIYNKNTLPPLIKSSLDSAKVTGAIGLPCLYFESSYEPGLGRNSYAAAFNPAAINLQWTDGGVAAVAKQFGPRNASNEDVFEKNLKSILGAGTVPLYDWYFFHIGRGEVHCGSAAERTPEPNWWTK